jgi:hypothetical protein
LAISGIRPAGQVSVEEVGCEERPAAAAAAAAVQGALTATAKPTTTTTTAAAAAAAAGAIAATNTTGAQDTVLPSGAGLTASAIGVVASSAATTGDEQGRAGVHVDETATTTTTTAGQALTANDDFQLGTRGQHDFAADLRAQATAVTSQRTTTLRAVGGDQIPVVGTSND